MNPPLATRRVLLALALAVAIPSASQTLMIPAVPELVRERGVGPTAATWLLSGFLIGASVAAPFLGRLGDLHGRRPLILASSFLYLVGSLVCLAGSSSLLVLVVGRLLPGVSAGIFVLALATVQDLFPWGRRAFGIGLLSAVVGIGPAVGFVVGGLLTELAGFESVFLLGAGVALVSGLLSWWWVPNSGGRAQGQVDVVGATLLAVWMTVPLVALSRAEVWGLTSLPMAAAGVLTVVLVWAWVLVERRATSPLVDVALLTRPVVARTNLASLVMAGATLGLFVTVPQLVQVPQDGGFGLGYGPIGAGLVLVPGAIVMLVVGPISAAVGARVGEHVCVVAGGVIAAVGLARFRATVRVAP